MSWKFALVDRQGSGKHDATPLHVNGCRCQSRSGIPGSDLAV